MDERLKRKSLVLLAELAYRPYRLDVEAVDALELRDSLEREALTAPERRAVEELDEQILLRAPWIVSELRRAGVMPSIEHLRAAHDRPRRDAWWWLDCVAEGRPIPSIPPSHSVPRGALTAVRLRMVSAVRFPLRSMPSALAVPARS